MIFLHYKELKNNNFAQILKQVNGKKKYERRPTDSFYYRWD